MLVTPKIFKYSLILLILVIFLSSLLMILPVLNHNFPFTTDQGRDMLDLREIVIGKKFRLIGPTTSINGVYLGPFYYYFNVIPFVLGSGDPQYLVFWNILCFLSFPFIFWFLNYKRNWSLALIFPIIFLFAPANFYAARYFWSANPMPYITGFYFLSLVFFLNKPTPRKGLFLGIISGLSMQFESAFGLLFFPFALFNSIITKKGLQPSVNLCLGFLLTLLPQILFEFKHSFIMTKTFISEVSGTSAILGDKLSFPRSLLSHLESFRQFSDQIFGLPPNYSLVLLITSVLFLSYLTYKKRLDDWSKHYFLTSLFFILFAFFFYSFYHYQIKGWYLLGLRIPYIISLSLLFTKLLSSKILFKTSLLKLLVPIVVVLLLVYSSVSTFIFQSKFIPKNSGVRTDDRSNLRNELETIDWVYQKAEGRGFRAYNYIPSVYDYPYQYLYWWYGFKKYGYHPETISYLDNVPEYIPGNKLFITNSKKTQDNLIFLIYEDDEIKRREYAWLGSFTTYCSLDIYKFDFQTTVEMRKPC